MRYVITATLFVASWRTVTIEDLAGSDTLWVYCDQGERPPTWLLADPRCVRLDVRDGQAVDTHLLTLERGTLTVLCQAAMSRSPSTAVMRLIVSEGHSPENALRMVRDALTPAGPGLASRFEPSLPTLQSLLPEDVRQELPRMLEALDIEYIP